MSIWDVLDPSCTYKKWKVDVMSYGGGHFKSFWFKKNALKYANGYKGGALFVDLVNNITEQSTRINDPRKQGKDIGCNHEWAGGGASWRCLHCGAEFNMACEHSGSIACGACVQEIMKEGIKKEGSWENYLAKESW